MIECDGCGEEMERGAVEAHKRDECVRAVVKCSMLGCDERVRNVNVNGLL